MISTGFLTTSARELDAPLVYLAPEKHAYLVLVDGGDMITWSSSYRFACEQADLHSGIVVAVPIVRDSSWRAAHADDPTQVPVPAAAVPRRNATPAASYGWPAGRAARAARGQGHPDGWSSARPDVVGEDHQSDSGPQRAVGTAAVTRVQRAAPFGAIDPAAWVPQDPEGEVLTALGGDPEAVAAFHSGGVTDLETLVRIRDALAAGETPAGETHPENDTPE